MEERMEDRLKKLYYEVSSILNSAPDNSECTDREAEVFDNLASLKFSLEFAGFY